MSVIYFPKEGDKKSISNSYPICEFGLAFQGKIEKLEVLALSGILRKVETDLVKFEKEEGPKKTDKTYEQWVEFLLKGKNPVVENIKVETKIEAPSEVKIEEEKVEEVVEDKVEETPKVSSNKKKGNKKN